MDHLADGAAPKSLRPVTWLAVQRAWLRLGIAILAGAAMTLGQPPVSVPWALFLAVPVLVWLVDAAPGPRAAALAGWGAGFGYFVTGLYWIGHAFLVDAEKFAWLMPFAVTLLPAFLGLFWAGAFALARRVWPQGRWWRVLTLAACLTFVEYARSNVLTGFPWALPGYVWVETPVMQAAAWAGPFGMTLITLAVTGLALTALIERRAAAAAIPVLVLVLLWQAGQMALDRQGAADGPVLRIVQPNAAQKVKWSPDHAPRFYARLLDATAAPADPALGPPKAVIWPETAVAFLPAYRPDRRAEIAQAANGVPVLLGALHGVERDGREYWFNSLTAILRNGELGPRYDKHHLVPFGEYLPIAGLLRAIGLRQLARQGRFSAGPGPQILDVPGLPPFSPLICYEMIFPDEVVPRGQRPAWILQVTNDAWFGSYGGPQQHLAQARIRAIEQGLPIVRAANTGISAVIDARGRILKQIPLGTDGFIDAPLPAPNPPTIYFRFGEIPAMALVLLIIFASVRLRPRSPEAG
ncbi:MAG: apolipoprotein N-acyltransferase [Paracoccaceae bacterium]|nr:apolipoprotein N-acyltransferase [Paracoccaceae bacterium]